MSAVGDSGHQQKTTFSQTCNLLSQYVKDKRSSTLSLSPFSSTPGTTMNLFPVKEEDTSGNIGRTIHLFPQSSGFTQDPKRELSCAQMTIFYGGQVLVFNDLPSDKAKQVFDLATTFESAHKKRKLDSNSNLNSHPVQSRVGPGFGQGQGVIPPRSPVTNATDLPIARKASLHRFLEKRKDRLVGKGPVSMEASGAPPTKPVEGKTWLGLGAMPAFQAPIQTQKQL